MLLLLSLLVLLSSAIEASKDAFHGTTALSTLVRPKRQIWYLCGQYPRQFYSNFPCYAVGNTLCENGGRKIGYGCTIPNHCTAFHVGPVACIRGCCCTVPGPQILPNVRSVQGYCPNGQLSNVRCSAPGQCRSGQTCMSGLCCTTTTNEYTVACGGQFAIERCGINQTCQSKMVCTASNYCCQCAVGRSGGTCNRGLCTAGFTCQSNGHCCPSCPGNSMPFGMCRNGRCGGGRTCSAGNICC